MSGRLLVLTVFVLAGCEHYEKPYRPLHSGFAVRTLDGNVLDTAALAGRPWVINLWVPGCGICVREFTELEAVRQQFEGQGVGFLAVSIEPDEALVKRAALRLGIRMTVGTTRNETLGPLSVNRVPSTVFLNAEGTIVAAASGARKRAFLEARTRELLAGVARERQQPTALNALGAAAPLAP